MIGSSPGMVEIYKTVSRVAPTDATVVIEGETGTGKELIARMIHRFSERAAHPFVPVDCASIPAALIESELFGAVKGAFTGADRDRIGVFEAANRGTVFPGRDRRYRACVSGEAAAFSAGAGDSPRGLVAREESRRACGGGDESRSAEDGGGRQVPRRSLVPSERGAADAAASARAPQRCSAAHAILPEQIQ